MAEAPSTSDVPTPHIIAGIQIAMTDGKKIIVKWNVSDRQMAAKMIAAAVKVIDTAFRHKETAQDAIEKGKN